MTPAGRSAERRIRRARRHARIGRKIRGTAERPRLVVSRSLRHIEGQLVDDDRGRTLLGLSTRSADVAEAASDEEDRVGESFVAGRMLGERALEEGIQKVVFDRAGYRYHGRVKAFAEGAREAGLDF